MARVSTVILRRSSVPAAAPKVSSGQLEQLEKFLDAIWATLGIDVEFTRHFKDRVNDVREKKQPITLEELRKLFQDAFQRFGNRFKGLITGGRGKEIEAVLSDISTKLNVPFVLRVDHREGDIDLVAKTVLRKANFRSSDRFFKVEGKMITKMVTATAKDLIQQVADGTDPRDALGINVIEDADDDFTEDEIIDEADSAAGVYKARRGEIDKQIKALQVALKKMDSQQKKNPQHWGFAGNLGEISNNIKEMVIFASSSRSFAPGSLGNLKPWSK